MARRPDCHRERCHEERGLCAECYRRTPARARTVRMDNWKRSSGIRDMDWPKYAELGRLMGWKCGICDIDVGEGKLVVDHRHGVPVARGLICRACNSALGHVRESPEILSKLRDYLVVSLVTERARLDQAFADGVITADEHVKYTHRMTPTTIEIEAAAFDDQDLLRRRPRRRARI
jgi:hypothetical protein